MSHQPSKSNEWRKKMMDEFCVMFERATRHGEEGTEWVEKMEDFIQNLLKNRDAEINKLINDAYLKGLSDAEMDKLDASRSNEELVEDIIYSSPFCYADRDTKDVNAMRKILMTTLQAVRDAEREKAVAEERRNFKKAFYKEFAGAGELWFPYINCGAETREEEMQAVDEYWERIEEALTPKISNNN